jgi:hypothetical protein
MRKIRGAIDVELVRLGLSDEDVAMCVLVMRAQIRRRTEALLDVLGAYVGSMTIEQWGAARDERGVCRVCGAEDWMWCDLVAHRN